MRRIATFLVGCASHGILTDATPPGAVENKKLMHPTAVKAADDLCDGGRQWGEKDTREMGYVGMEKCHAWVD